MLPLAALMVAAEFPTDVSSLLVRLLLATVQSCFSGRLWKGQGCSAGYFEWRLAQQDLPGTSMTSVSSTSTTCLVYQDWLSRLCNRPLRNLLCGRDGTGAIETCRRWFVNLAR